MGEAEASHPRNSLVAVDAGEFIAEVTELYVPMDEDEGGTLPSAAAPGLHVLGGNQLLEHAQNEGVRDGDTPQIAVIGNLDNDKLVITVADQAPASRCRTAAASPNASSASTKAAASPATGWD